MTDEQLYFNILRFLAINGIGKPIDIFSLFSDYKTQPPKTKEATIGSRGIYLDEFLTTIKNHGYISYNGFDYELKADQEQDKVTAWMETFVINASITPAGLNFYQQLKINNASMKSFGSQKNGMIATIFIAVVAVLISGLNLYLTFSKKDGLRTEIQKLQGQVDTLKSVQKQQSNQKASIAAKYHK